nr:MAG TPA: hypothetical protein [Caudoviricetes sp.]
MGRSKDLPSFLCPDENYFFLFVLCNCMYYSVLRL